MKSISGGTGSRDGESVQERVARMIDWGARENLCHCKDCVPSFEKSLNDCRQVLRWIKAQGPSFTERFVGELYNVLGRPHVDNFWVMWTVLNATPAQICQAALAVGESREAKG